MYWFGPAAGGAAIFTAGKKTAKLSDATTGAPRGKPLGADGASRNSPSPIRPANASPLWSGWRRSCLECAGWKADAVCRRRKNRWSSVPMAGVARHFRKEPRGLESVHGPAAQTTPLPELDRDAVVQAHLNFDGTRVVQWDAHGKSASTRRGCGTL
jgi:hypothetical protein